MPNKAIEATPMVVMRRKNQPASALILVYDLPLSIPAAKISTIANQITPRIMMLPMLSARVKRRS